MLEHTSIIERSQPLKRLFVCLHARSVRRHTWVLMGPEVLYRNLHLITSFTDKMNTCDAGHITILIPPQEDDSTRGLSCNVLIPTSIVSGSH